MAPLRPSKRVGRAIQEEGQGRAGVLPSGSCLPPGTSWTRELLLFILARAVTYGYECTVGEYDVTKQVRTYVRTYVRTCVRIRKRARYNSERTTWLMPLADSGPLLTLSLTHESWIFFAVWRGKEEKEHRAEEKDENAREETRSKEEC